MNIRVSEWGDQLSQEYNPCFGKQLGIDKLESLGGEVDISEISREIEVRDSENLLEFYYYGLLLGFIDFKYEDNVMSLEFIGNINMGENDAILYSVAGRGLESYQNEDIRIEGLGKYMLEEFIEYIRQYFPEVEIILAEIDNPRVIEIFTKLNSEKIIGSCHEDIDTDEKGFSRKYLQAYL